MAGASKPGCRFLDKLAKEVCVTTSPATSIVHQHYDSKEKTVTGREHKVTDTRFRVDGYVPRDKCKPDIGFPIDVAGLAIEFHGHIWHGHPDEKRHDETNYRGFRYGDMYNQTMERMRTINAKHYTVLYIWESDFYLYEKAQAKANPDERVSLLSYCKVI
jgi:hypothetical protein